MDHTRQEKMRLLISKLNKERKKQAKKIDILCNDFIAAQRDFIKGLKTISFIANFYESIIGITDLNSLLYTAVKLIKAEYADANVTFFLRQTSASSVESSSRFSYSNFEILIEYNGSDLRLPQNL